MNFVLKSVVIGTTVLSLSACSLLGRQTAPTTPPATDISGPVESGPLGPVLGGGESLNGAQTANSREITIGGVPVCRDADRQALFARLADPAARALLERRSFLFGTDSSELDTDAAAVLAAHAQLLAAQPQARAYVAGHTDERGTQDYNLALGERRANAVARLLTSSGVQSQQLTVVSFGEEQPAATGSDESAWAQNRRVVMEYTVCR